LSSFSRQCLLLALLWLGCRAAIAGNVVRFAGSDIDNNLRFQIQAKLHAIAPASANDSIIALLSDVGYLSARVNRLGDTIIIDPGRRYLVGNLKAIVVTATGDVVEKGIDHPYGLAASKSSIDQIRQEIIEQYQHDGYYFASLGIDSARIGDGVLDLTCRIITGPVVHINRITFSGLRHTDTAFAQNLSGLKPGDPFTRTNLLLATRRLENAEFLQQDSSPAIFPNEVYDRVDLEYFLSERKSSLLELAGGLVPRQGSRPADFIGRIHLQSQNLFGSGRKFNFLFDRKDRYSSQTDFSFAQPLFIPDHLELSTHLSQVKYDSSYHSFTLSGAVALFTAAGTRLTGEVSWTKTEPQSQFLERVRTLAATAGYNWTSLDYPSNPRTGRTLHFTLSYLRRSIPPDSATTQANDNESMFSLGADNYIPLARALVLRVNMSAKVRITARDLLDYSEEFKMGGYGSLRGYRQDQFSGRRVALGQTELRLRPGKLFALYGFADIGYVYTKQEVALGVVSGQSLTRFGSGAGMYVGGDTARLTFEVGWGKGDHLSDGKLHLGLATLF